MHVEAHECLPELWGFIGADSDDMGLHWLSRSQATCAVTAVSGPSVRGLTQLWPVRYWHTELASSRFTGGLADRAQKDEM